MPTEEKKLKLTVTMDDSATAALAALRSQIQQLTSGTTAAVINRHDVVIPQCLLSPKADI